MHSTPIPRRSTDRHKPMLFRRCSRCFGTLQRTIPVLQTLRLKSRMCQPASPNCRVGPTTTERDLNKVVGAHMLTTVSSITSAEP
eukprot:7814183-Pyramimonas_sp.AAC.3